MKKKSYMNPTYFLLKDNFENKTIFYAHFKVFQCMIVLFFTNTRILRKDINLFENYILKVYS